MLDAIMSSLSLPFSFMDAQTSDHLVMYTRASTHTVHTHVQAHIHSAHTSKCTPTCTHTCTHTHMQAHIHSAHPHAHTCKCTPTCTRMQVHTHIHKTCLSGCKKTVLSRVMQQQITDFVVLLCYTLLMRPNQNSTEKTHTSVYTY